MVEFSHGSEVVSSHAHRAPNRPRRYAHGRLNTRLRELETAWRLPWQLSRPIYLQIENTNRCNLACSFCARATWNRELNPPGDMTEDTFNRIRPLLRYSPIVAIQGVGEPLVSDNVWWMMREVKAYHCHLIINTNGTLLHQENAQRLIEGQVDKIFVSIDAATDATFRSLRGIDVTPIISNLKRLLEMRTAAQSATPSIVVVFVAMKKNLNELPELVAKLASIGVRDMEIRHLKIYKEELSDQALFDDHASVSANLLALQQTAAELGITMTLPADCLGQTVGCRQPFEMMFFRHDGEVYGCCSAAFKGSPFNQPIGHLSSTSVIRLWNSSYIRALRNGLYGRSPLAEQCRLCAFRVASGRAHNRVHEPSTSDSSGPEPPQIRSNDEVTT